LLSVHFLFKFLERKKDKIWTKDLKKLLKEKELKTDKKLHEELLLKESYINSIERLKKFLLKIFNNKEEVFSLTPLDAYLLIEMFPFDIRKSKDGKYYLVNENDFFMFLKLLVNKNYKYISNKELLKLRDNLMKKLLSWNKDEIVVDAKYIFELIKNNHVPSPNIEEQKFIQISSSFKNKISFKIESEFPDDEIIEKETKEKENKKNQDISILKGKNCDYMIDLKTGLQYVINKRNSDEENNKNKEKNELKMVQDLVENLTILIHNQPKELHNAIREIAKELKENNLNVAEAGKKLEEEILEKIDDKNNPEIKKEVQEKINLIMQKPTAEINNLNLHNSSNVEEENKNENKNIKPNIGNQIANQDNNASISSVPLDKNNEEKDKDLLDEYSSENFTDNFMQDDNFGNDFGLNGNKNVNNTTKNKNEEESDKIFFFLKEIENYFFKVD